MKSRKMIDKKVALVTGASRGIGKSICRTLAQDGNLVVVNYVANASEAEHTKEIIESEGGEVLIKQADVTDIFAVKDMFKDIKKRFGRLDFLINNAGVTDDGYFIMSTQKQWDRVIGVNLNAVFLCSKEAAMIMASQREGVIVNIGSGSAIVAQPGQVNYSAAKAGLFGFTRSLARELAPRGINVVHIAPGFIETDMTDILSKNFIEETFRLTPLNRWGKPQEIASLVKYLVNGGARCFNGQHFVVDGGRGSMETETGWQHKM
ncbi:MAG: 3-oxoacyl-ACP reductase family protein [Pseudomonadota bacterium]|nr:3-oxoacyl-ACP reductase family protein [Pseudomonadota bacterium]